ncbi:hypothetical protein AGMMS49960_22200 [Betaproteobacteria bacterium]|nr:hypothetical protein AGMMS49960_22200 [Betaproteobacteria bacterium]
MVENGETISKQAYICCTEEVKSSNILSLLNEILFKYRVLDFHISARRCNVLLSGVNFDTISPAKSTLKKVFFTADLYVNTGILA